MNAATALMFLDIDDVLCLSSPYGGYAALEAVDGQHADPAAVYRDLFVPRARDALRRVHDEMGGALNYVISSTWREVFERAQLETVFRRSGLDFVADRLCEGARWCTPPTRHANQRVHQIAQWLDRHHRGDVCSRSEHQAAGAVDRVARKAALEEVGAQARRRDRLYRNVLAQHGAFGDHRAGGIGHVDR